MNHAKNQILESIRDLLAQKPRVTVAIDGRCASGKTTLAQALSETLSCPVIHMDDFFLPPHMRTPERLAEPGGNVDRERFYAEVLTPLMAGSTFSYRPFDCSTQTLTAPLSIPPSAVTLVEGSYSCHPSLWNAYDLHVFLTVSPETQADRILCRNGKTAAEVFRSRWIPLEEAYFQAFDIQAKCDLSFDLS